MEFCNSWPHGPFQMIMWILVAVSNGFLYDMQNGFINRLMYFRWRTDGNECNFATSVPLQNGLWHQCLHQFHCWLQGMFGLHILRCGSIECCAGEIQWRLRDQKLDTNYRLFHLFSDCRPFRCPAKRICPQMVPYHPFTSPPTIWPYWLISNGCQNKK